MMKQLNVRSRVDNGYTLISLSGELDAESTSEESNLLKIIDNGTGVCLIDCSELEYISSAGVSVFLSMSHACRGRKVFIVFFGLKPKIKNILEMIGLQRTFNFAASLEEAQKLHQSRQPAGANLPFAT